MIPTNITTNTTLPLHATKLDKKWPSKGNYSCSTAAYIEYTATMNEVDKTQPTMMLQHMTKHQVPKTTKPHWHHVMWQVIWHWHEAYHSYWHFISLQLPHAPRSCYSHWQWQLSVHRKIPHCHRNPTFTPHKENPSIESQASGVAFTPKLGNHTKSAQIGSGGKQSTFQSMMPWIVHQSVASSFYYAW